MKVHCAIEFVEIENDDGREVESVQATCSLCGHVTESYGTESVSVRRALALMREECPENERNFYIAEDGEDEE
jgi:hypothetical protein